MKPLFSFVTTVYNVESYLKQCIESMVGQTYTNIEIILVDDGSPDACPQICDEYAKADDRIKVIHKKNGGIVSARQAGDDAATGDYIINVDGDDWVEKNYCMKMAIVIDRYHPTIVMCGHYKDYEDKTIEYKLPRRYGFYERKDIEKEIIPIFLQNEHGKGFELSLWAKAVERRRQQRHHLVDVVVNVGEDIACMAPCVYHADSIYIMEDCFYHYRQNPYSMTKNKKAFSWDGPELRGHHLEKHLIPRDENIQQQIYRATVHALFTTTKSQFNRNDVSIDEIKQDIRSKLEYPYYMEAIKKSRFKGLAANLMKYSLQWRWLSLIRLMNRLQ